MKVATIKVAGAWLEAEGTQAVLSSLQAAGHLALFVGGCVRNAILGLPAGDIDITTDALPDAVTRIATNAGFRVVPTGIDHGTVTVIAGGVAYEVTTLRKDVQTDGRHAVVAYSDSVEVDAARRDFTMNALYAQADGTVIDPIGGIGDLIARRVRFVGDAQRRIREDYLRILRFFRFYAIYGDPSEGPDAEGLGACAADAAGIGTLSRERIGAEMRKLLSAQNPAPAVAAMERAGVLMRVMPGASGRFLPVLVHLESGSQTSWQCRLACLGGADPAAALRLSRAEAATLAAISEGVESLMPPDALGWLRGMPLASDIVLARAALSETALAPNWHLEVARGAAAVFPVSAADLMPGLQGAELGARLKVLQDRWLASGLTLSRGALLA